MNLSELLQSDLTLERVLPDGVLRRFLSPARRARLYVTIAAHLENRLELAQSLQILATVSEEVGGLQSYAQARLCALCRARIVEGGLLSDGLLGWVPDGEELLVRAGESGDRVAQGLRAAAGLAQAIARMRGAALGAVAYPTFLATMVVGFIAVFGFEVVPQFASFSPPETWTGSARSLGLLAEAAPWLVPLLSITLVALIAGVIWSLPHWTGRLRNKLDKLPPYSIYRLVTGISFMEALAGLLSSGVMLDQAMEMISRRGSAYLGERCDRTLAYLREGYDLGAALQATGYDFPDPWIVGDLRAYASTGQYEDILTAMSSEWLQRSQEDITAMSRRLNALALIVVGMTIMWLVTSFYDLQSQLRGSFTNGR